VLLPGPRPSQTGRLRHMHSKASQKKGQRSGDLAEDTRINR
jgi:hypothetical protein